MKRDFWQSLAPDQKKRLAQLVESTPEYLRQVFMYDRTTGARLARRLAEATGGVVGPHEFCPEAFDQADSLNYKHGSRPAA